MTKRKSNDLTKEQIEKLLKNEYQMDSIGTDTMEIPLVEPKKQDVTDSSDVIEVAENVEYNDIVFPARGFKSLDEAIEYMHTKLKNQGPCTQKYFMDWLIKK